MEIGIAEFMISFEQWFLFLSITFAVSASPGPLMLLTMSNGINYGYIRSLPGVFGASSGNLILVFFTGLGISLLFQLDEKVFASIKWAGIFYLLYLGLKQIVGARAAGNTIVRNKIIENATGIFLKSFLVSLTNPKGLIYFIALFPQFVDVDKPLYMQFVILTVTFLLTDFIWMSIYAKGGHLLKVWLETGKHNASIRYISGGLLLLAALILLSTD